MKYYFKCPQCSSDERFIEPSEQPSDVGSWLFLSGGLIAALTFANYKRQRVQCAHCGHLFQQPALPRSPIGKFAILIAAVTVILMSLALLFCFSPDIVDALPPLPVVNFIENAVATAPRVV